jgi:hypothetical protein
VNENNSHIQLAFRRAKSLLKVGGVFAAFYVAPSAGVYCLTGLFCEAALAWVGGNMTLGIIRDISPRFSKWLTTQVNNTPAP